MRTALLACMTALVSAQPGCNSIKCGPGTFKQGDECIGYDPSDHTPPVTTIMPGGERSRAAVPDPITLSANEPATVYYTTDGTDPDPATTPGHRDMATIRGLGTAGTVTVKYFSIDTAGNREDEQSATFIQDLTAPAPVTGMSVTVTGTTAHVTWTNPTDPDWAGTAVARIADVVDGAPSDGHLPLLQDEITPSLQIVSIGNATSFDDVGVKPGLARYVAWTYDDLGNYSGPTVAGATVPLGSLAAELVFDTTTSKLTINKAPADIDISATTATFASGTLTVTLVAKNQSWAYLGNPKVEVTSVTGATFTGQDGTADTYPYKSIGPAAFAPGAQVMPDLVFTTSAATITIDLAFASHATMLLTNGLRGTNGALQLYDLGTDQAVSASPFPLVSTGPGGGVGGRARTPAVIGGHYIDVPTTHGAIERFDLATDKPSGIATVTDGAASNLQGLVAVDGGELAVVKLTSKGRARFSENRSGQVEIIRLDEGLHVLQTVQYPFSESTGTCQPALSPDGSVLALASDNTVALVDARTLAQIDADPTTPDPDTFVPASTGRIGSIVWLSDTDLLVLTRRTGQAALVKRTGTTYTTSLVYDDKTTMSGGFGAATAPDGKIWMAFPTSVQVYDPVAGTVTALPGFTSGAKGVARLGSDMWLIHSDQMGMDRVASDGAIQHTITIPQQYYYLNYSCSPNCNGIYGHWLAIVP